MQTMIQIPFTDYNYYPPAKQCKQCGNTKPLQHFYKEKTKLDGRRANCKACKRAKDTAHQNNKYAINEEYREYRKANSKRQHQRNMAMHSVAH